MNLNFFLLENCIAYNGECVLLVVVAVVMVVGVVVYALSMFWYSNGMKISYLWNTTFSVGLSTVFRSVHLFIERRGPICDYRRCVRVNRVAASVF